MIITLYDLIPVFGIVATIAGLGYRAGQIVQELKHNTEDIKEIRIELKDMSTRLTVVETKLSGSNQKSA
jgi:hypothetical protein